MENNRPRPAGQNRLPAAALIRCFGRRSAVDGARDIIGIDATAVTGGDTESPTAVQPFRAEKSLLPTNNRERPAYQRKMQITVRAGHGNRIENIID